MCSTRPTDIVWVMSKSYVIKGELKPVHIVKSIQNKMKNEQWSIGYGLETQWRRTNMYQWRRIQRHGVMVYQFGFTFHVDLWYFVIYRSFTMHLIDGSDFDLLHQEFVWLKNEIQTPNWINKYLIRHFRVAFLISWVEYFEWKSP